MSKKPLTMAHLNSFNHSSSSDDRSEQFIGVPAFWPKPTIKPRFLWRDWVGTENQVWSDHYPQANQLFRGDDIMLRVEYNLRFSRFNANTGLLAIYRPTRDRIKVEEREITVDGTDGLALTYLLGFGYKFNVRSAIKVGTGFRLRRRAKNPDGLSREFVNTVTYQFNF